MSPETEELFRMKLLAEYYSAIIGLTFLSVVGLYYFFLHVKKVWKKRKK
jgi:hypothetical protein